MKWALVPLAAMIVIGTAGLEAVAWTGITWEMLFGSLVMLLVAAVAAQIYRYRRVATPAQRQQTRAVVLVLALLPIWLLTSLLIERFAGPPWNALGSIVQLHLGIIVPTLIPLTLGIAALRYQLWDVAPIVRRTFVYTVLTLAVASIYILAVGATASTLYGAGQPAAHHTRDWRRGDAGTPGTPMAAAPRKPLSIRRAGCAGGGACQAG